MLEELEDDIQYIKENYDFDSSILHKLKEYNRKDRKNKKIKLDNKGEDNE